MRTTARSDAIARLHPALIELAAGRPLSRIEDPGDLVRAAIEHRVAGLLWSRIAAGEVRVAPSESDALLRTELRVWGRQQLLWKGLVDITRRLEAMGIRTASAKGITAEARWYTRSGERPCLDLDLLVAPDAIGRVGEIVRSLMPTHPLRDDVQGLVDNGALQSVELVVGGVDVDLHTDLLKLEIVRTRQGGAIWERVVPLSLPNGGTVEVIDPETSLIHFLVHLTKDRFAYLGGFADVARVLAKEELDWGFIDRFVRTEGIEACVYLALDAVVDTLRIARPRHPIVRGWRASMLRRSWPPRSRLQGDVGRFTARRRQFLIALLARGRMVEALHGYAARLVPPPALARYQAPAARGPYLWRITGGRVGNALGRRAAVARLRATRSGP